MTNMLIKMKINKVPVLFIKAFTAADVQAILEFVRDAARFSTKHQPTVLFIDTPITSATVEAVEKLKREHYRVVFRDHHYVDGTPTNDRERQVIAAAGKLKQLLNGDCEITVRRLHPACSTLVEAGEFADALAIIADPDADGLTAAMKAAGLTYDGLDDDAAKLDSEPQLQVTGTPLSQLLAKGIAVIPSYDSSNPKEREIAHQELFETWVMAVAGNDAAIHKLEEKVAVYDQAVQVARDLAETASLIAPGVVLVDVANKPLYDPGTLNALLEAIDGCRVSVVRKSLGPIAALHGIQYSLAVVKAHQRQVNLQDLVPSDAKSDPEGGIIANVSFLLHVSEDIWHQTVFPQLKHKF